MSTPLRWVVSSVVPIVLWCCSAGVGREFDANDSPDGADAVGAPDAASGIGIEGGSVEAGPGTCVQDIDVVLVLDTSSTMSFVLDALDGEFEQVVSASNELQQGAHFGLVFFQDNHAFDQTGEQQDGKVHLTHATMQTAFRDVKRIYTNNDRNPGDGPNGPTVQNPLCEENSLDALYAAATEFPWRARSARIVVVATDDTFLERPDNYGDRDGDGDTSSTSFPREGDYPAHHTLDETVTALNDAKVKVFSFSRLTPPTGLRRCSTGRRHASGESVAYGWSQPYAGKAPIPAQTGGQNFDLARVQDGSVSLGDAIRQIVLETHCSEVN